MSKLSLGPRYGKQSVPVFKIRKQGAHHEVIDLVVRIMLEGDVSDSWLTGENHQILPTETQKNTCYALAALTEYDCPETYALALGADILRRHGHFDSVTLDVEQRKWERIVVGGKGHNHAFYAPKDAIKGTCHVVVTRSTSSVTSGVKDVKIMKTTQSGFKGFIKDKYTTLQPVGAGTDYPDRIMCTEMDSTWTWSRKPRGGYAAANKAVFETLIAHFAGPPDTGVFSKSLQETTYKMATAALAEFPELTEVYLGTPNVHFYRSELEKFGIPNPNVVFQSTDCHSTASGRIETHLARTLAKL
eukprot:m.130601 g.130601  ORF g.130601 m.130601 type:complete len:302 (+) comp16795_c0_seq4:192-1097(+)